MTPEEIAREYEIVRSSAKDPERFRELYDKYFETIFRFVFRRVDDEDITADVTSQVFFNALKNIRKYKFKGVPFSAWLYRIATNEIAKYYRANNKKLVFSLEEEIFREIVDKNIDDNSVDHSELITMMKSLSDKEAEILELRFFEGKTFAEISYILDISEAGAKMRTYRALEKLKQLLNYGAK